MLYNKHSVTLVSVYNIHAFQELKVFRFTLYWNKWKLVHIRRWAFNLRSQLTVNHFVHHIQNQKLYSLVYNYKTSQTPAWSNPIPLFLTNTFTLRRTSHLPLTQWFRPYIPILPFFSNPKSESNLRMEAFSVISPQIVTIHHCASPGVPRELFVSDGTRPSGNLLGNSFEVKKVCIFYLLSSLGYVRCFFMRSNQKWEDS